MISKYYLRINLEYVKFKRLIGTCKTTTQNVLRIH